jgi:HAD superfamily hydrolase (TIGR01493 family)
MADISRIRCVAFDCFGTVFDMSGVHNDEIYNYVNHVRRDDFTPFTFPDSWWYLKAHTDSAEGIRRLQSVGLVCVALSNGSRQLINHISLANTIEWNHIVSLIAHRVYKPHRDAYLTIQADLGIVPSETLLVTANPSFGDIEGAAAVGMQSQVIRHGHPNTIIELAEMLKGFN